NPASNSKNFRLNLANPSNAIINGAHGPDNNSAFWGVGTIYTCDPPPSGLISWWPAENNTNDVQSGNNGTPQNGATFAAGQVGRAFSFNGANQYVLIGDPVPPALKIQNEITLSAWIYVTSYPNSGDQLALIIGSQYDTNHAGATIFLDGRTNPDGTSGVP